jgi:hypothetical protein
LVEQGLDAALERKKQQSPSRERIFDGEKEDGLHDYDLAEDSESAIAINVTYCVYYEIPRLCGVAEACDPFCYRDEVFFPGYLEPLGIRFGRTKTLARGGDCCDFRFEKI